MNDYEGQKCPIWATPVRTSQAQGDFTLRIQGSDRVGCDYVITREAELMLGGGYFESAPGKRAKMRLVTTILDRHAAGDPTPRVTPADVHSADRGSDLPVHERAERLLRYLVSLSVPTGRAIPMSFKVVDQGLAWSESLQQNEFHYFIGYLTELGFLISSGSKPADEPIRDDEQNTFFASYIVSVKGHERVGAQAQTIDVEQVFVAMWFDDSMNDVYDKAIAPAIEATGYKPLRVDREEGNLDLIDDQIVGEIRRSRFLVADFTHDEKGARGSVYYEAGFAKGLDLPIIFTCRDDGTSQLHFDTSHFPYVMWKDISDLRTKLERRILGAIGERTSDMPM